jgi:hypothetical protein
MPRERAQVPIKYDAAWPPQLVWKFLYKQWVIKPWLLCFPARSQIAITTALPRLHFNDTITHKFYIFILYAMLSPSKCRVKSQL